MKAAIPARNEGKLTMLLLTQRNVCWSLREADGSNNHFLAVELRLP
jgi:hypothetical protein